MNGQKPLWRNGNFVLLWSSEIVTAVGDEVYNFVMPWLAYVVTGRAGALTTLRFLQYTPNIALAPWVGRWLDRAGPMRAAWLSALVAAGELLALALLLRWRLNALLLYAFTVAIGIFTFAQWMALQAVVPWLFERSELVRVNARLSLVFTASTGIGPALGGLLTARYGGAAGLLADAASFAVLAGLLQAVKSPPREASPRREPGNLREELGYLRARRPLWVTTLAVAGFNLFGAAVGPLTMFHLAHDLHAGAAAVGLLFGLGATGNVLAGLVLPSIARRLRPGAMMTAGVLLNALSVTLIGLSRSRWQVGAMLVASRFATTSLNVVYGTIRQEASDPDHVGRVFALTSMLANAASFVAAGIGWIGDLAGAPAVIVAAGLGMGAVGVAFSRALLTMGEAGPRVAAGPEGLGG
ncbi:MAG: MFS transporter [Bacillota bacterium]|nr:MFS transporter [Bacillota bacterium]